MRVRGRDPVNYLFDHSEADAARDAADRARDREEWLQEQLALALAQRSRMFALGYQTAVEDLLGEDIEIVTPSEAWRGGFW
ncbi:MAG TPA: hypothetical protein VFQ22_10555 [Longimicrobiales bacterium]|nr:hypothetical protein [Longimicrobiales bacterium]